MVLFNYSTKELTAKIVYYGPGLCGKTSNLQYIHGNLPGNVKGKMLSLATKTDRTLFFDFLPIDLGEIRGMKTRVQLYTVPGQVFYNETRKLVLKGADGIVFVADSQEQMLSANAESFKNLEENLKGHGLTLADMPHVIQFNKRDLPKLASIEQLNSGVNKYNAPFYESVATTGIGIQDTLKAITKLVLLHLTKKYDPRAGASTAAAPVAPQPAAAPVIQTAPPAAAETQAIPLASVQPSQVDRQTIAIAPEAVPEVRPEPALAASVEPAPQPAAVNPEFDDTEIDQLVGEVEDLEELATTAPEPIETFQIDDSNVPLEQPVDTAPTLAAPDPVIEPIAPVAESEPPALDLTPETPFTDQPADFSEPVTEIMEPAASIFDEPMAEVDEPVAAFEEALPEHQEPVLFEQPDTEVEESEADEAAGLEQPRDEILLTDVADDQALFDDPGIDVTGVAPGEEREIVIPVEIGGEGAKQRFKLSVRLRLDPVD